MKRTVLSALCLCCIGGSMAGLLLSADAVRPDQVALGPVVLAESGKPASGAAEETEVRMPSQDVIDLYKAGKLREARESLVRLARSEIKAVKGITRSRRIDLARGLGISLSANTIAHCFDLEVKHGDGSVSDELVQIAEDVLPAVDLALQRAQKGPTSEIRFKQKIQYAKDKKRQLLGKLIAVLRAAGRGKKADAIADRYKEDLQRGKATKRPATRPADLDAIAKRLTKAIGDTWEKENLTILGKPVTVLKATVVWTAPTGLTRSICRLYPFGFDRSGRKKIIASPSEGDAGYAVVGYGDRWTVTAYPAFGNPAEMIPGEAIAKAMGLKSQYITGSSLHCARWLEDNFDQFVLQLRHHGPKDKRLPSLTISARRIKDAKDSPEQLYAVIGRKPGLELIHHLLLARCFEDVKGDKFRYPEGPVYTVTVPGGDRWKQHKLKYYKDFGWGPGMLKRLDALGKVLDGDAAKAMDKLLKRLEGRRQQWQRTAETIEKLAAKSDLIVAGTVAKTYDVRARDAGMRYDIRVQKVLKGKLAGKTLHFRSPGHVAHAKYRKGETVLLFLYYWGDRRQELRQLKPVTYVAKASQSIPAGGLRLWPIQTYLDRLGAKPRARTQPATQPTTQPAISLRLSLSANSGQVVFVNSGAQSYSLYRDALSLSASGKTQDISPHPIVFPPEMPIALTPGATVAWRILVKENNIYPYNVAHGGFRLLEKEHKIKAVYQEGSLGRLESNTVTYKIE